MPEDHFNITPQNCPASSIAEQTFTPQPHLALCTEASFTLLGAHLTGDILLVFLSYP